MQTAISLYMGGNPIDAAAANYTTSRELGIICPFCRESLYLVKAFIRKGSPVSASWRHYKIGIQSNYCEERSLSKEGKAELKQLQPKAHNQRLKLFNRRFWQIFSHRKSIPNNLKALCISLVGKDVLDQIVHHCHERWNPHEILKDMPLKISEILNNPEVKERLKIHPTMWGAPEYYIDEFMQEFEKTKISALRYKILCESVQWLSTPTAKDAFSKSVQLGIVDCAEAMPGPLRTQNITDMMVISLMVTDWERAIEALEDKTKAIGFG